MPPAKRHIFAADIGGTNSRFARFGVDGEGNLSLVSLTWMKTAAADSLSALLDRLQESGFPGDPRQDDIVAIAVAGPVTGGAIARPPHIPWTVDITHAGRDYGFRQALLINDFVAQAYACLSPLGHSAGVILPGRADPNATIAVIGAGTGLGKAMLAPDEGGGYIAVPSEGAHAAFPFVGESEFALQRFLSDRRQTPYPTGDQVVSGSGLAAIHAFLTGQELEPAQVAERFPRHPETLQWFARFYGRACRDFALEALARGGLYIVGGIAAQTPGIVRHDAFREEFLASAAMGSLLARLPVFLIGDRNSGLWGAAMKAAGRLAAGRPRNPVPGG